MPEEILFDLRALGPRGVQLAQLAGGGEPAGLVETITGSVSVRRANGETDQLGLGDEVFMGDTIEVGGQGSIGVIFADETTLALGSGAEMVIDEMVYDPTGDSASMALSIADGVFSFVSGQISKTGDEAMVINTPVATIGIRGTKGAGVAAPEGTENRISLMAEDDGQVGELIVRTQGGLQVLNQAGQTVAFSSRFEAPPTPELLSTSEIEGLYTSALSVLPPTRPRPLAPENRQNQADQNAEQGEQEAQAPQEGGEDPGAEASGETAAEGEEGEAIEEALAESGAFEDNPEAAEAAIEAYNAALAEGATLEEAVAAALAAGQAVVAGIAAQVAQEELLQEAALNVDGPAVEPMFTKGVAGALQNASQAGDGGTFSNDVGSLGTESEASEEETREENELVGENLPAEDQVGDAEPDGLGDGPEGDELLSLDSAEDFGLEGFADAGDLSLGFGDIGLTEPDSLLSPAQDGLLAEDILAEDDEADPDAALVEEVAEEPAAAPSTATGSIVTTNTLTGTTSLERIIGTSANDEINGDQGDDWIMGDSGSDVLNGDDGDDVLYGDTPKLGRISVDGSGFEISLGATMAASARGDVEADLSGTQVEVFVTSATLLPGDINSSSDIYALKNGSLELISADSIGAVGDAGSTNGIINGDGTYIYFDSLASNLDANADGTNQQVFRKNLSTDAVELVTVLSDGTTQGNGTSTLQGVSDDGRYVLFVTSGTNFATDVGATDTNATNDLYIKDMSSGTLQLVSKNVAASAATGDAASGGASISGDGSTVVFESFASDFYDNNADNISDDASIQSDIFVFERTAGEITKIASRADGATGAQDSAGSSFNAAVSSDGRYVVFESDATVFDGIDTGVSRDIYLRDTSTDITTRITTNQFGGEPDGSSFRPDVSDDGQYVVYHSSATDLASGTDINSSTTDVYITQVSSGETRRLNVPLGADQGGTASFNARISGDGSKIFFESSDSTLVPGDGNSVTDVFAASNPFILDSGAIDEINGGAGNDTIWGGAGDDTLTGGTGNDIFYFKENDGNDVITDFESGIDEIWIDIEYFVTSGTPAINFEYVSGTYDGTNAVSGSTNVIQDDTGQLYYDDNGNATGGYSVIATVDGDTVVAGDLDIQE